MKLYFTVSSYSKYQDLNRKLLKLLLLLNVMNDMVKVLTITECEQNRAKKDNNAFFNVRHSIIFPLLYYCPSTHKFVVNSFEEAH